MLDLHTPARTRIAAMIAALLAIAAIGVLVPAHGDARSVPLSAARLDPAQARLIPAHHAWTPREVCPWTEYNVYTARGGAYGDQVWAGAGTPYPHVVWHRNGAKHSVTYDGVTFRNHDDRAILAAGWCQ